jgi:hypothetical protein
VATRKQEIDMKIVRIESSKIVRIESSYHPGKGYHLDGASREIKMPRRRWFDSFEEMMAAVERLNPDVEFV